MAKSQHVIELNGQKYDALTGKIVADVTKPVVPPVHAAKHVDGFVRRKATGASPTVNPSKRAPAPHTPAGKVHQTTERSKTLMRTTVKKPVHHAQKIHAKATVSKPSQTPTSDTHPSTNLLSSNNTERIQRATHISQSSLIRKFSVDKAATRFKTAIVPVKSAPKDHNLPTLQAVAAPVSQPAATVNPFDKALEVANSHFEPRVRKVRTHERIAKKLHVKPGMITAGSVGLVVLVIGSFLAYQHVPNVALKVANAKSGVQANLPGYQPAGFSLSGPIDATAGQVSVFYQSNSDDRNFKVIQRSSDWNSQSLLDNFVTNENKQYQTMQVKGRTIYLYDSNATWVDGGVWYQISGDSQLNRDQILRIAGSL